MAWDTSKSAGDLITSSDWNSMVTDQKGHVTRHESGGGDELSLGGLSAGDDTSIKFGAAPDAEIGYDSANDRLEIRDAGVPEDVIQIPMNGSGDIAIPNRALDMGSNNIDNVGNVDGVNISNHSTRHESGGSDEIALGGLNAGDDSDITFGAAPDAQIGYDATNDRLEIRDAGASEDLVRLPTDGTSAIHVPNRNLDIDNDILFADNSTGRDSAIPSNRISSNHTIHMNFKFGQEGTTTTSTSLTAINGSDVAVDFDRFKDRSGSVFINIKYHLSGDATAEVYRQNAGTTVTGTQVSTTAAVGSWSFAESGWIDMSSETGNESYQIRLRSDDGNTVGYNSIIMYVATPQG